MRELTPAEQNLVFDYLDGELRGKELEAFERSMVDDPRLAEVVREQRTLAARLTAAYPAMDAPPAPLGLDEGLRAAPATRSRYLTMGSAIAAMVVLALGFRFALLGYSAWNDRLDAARLYARATLRFEPEIVCDTPQKFAAYTEKAFGVGMLADFGTGVQLVGWTSPFDGYAQDPDAYRGPRILLARAPSGEEVIVIFDSTSFFAPKDTDAADVNLFERKVGGVRMTEVTPLDRPVVLDLLEKAD